MAGNTVVAKPSEMTTVTAWMLAKLFDEVQLPTGVFNLVCGLGARAGEAIVKHRDVAILSFTGSTVVGQRIASIAAPAMKKLSLELGGKNAAIVFDDVDLDKVVPALIRSSFLNQVRGVQIGKREKRALLSREKFASAPLAFLCKNRSSINWFRSWLNPPKRWLWVIPKRTIPSWAPSIPRGT